MGVDAALGLIPVWIENLSHRQQKSDVAVRALLTAANATMMYIADCADAERNRSREHSLVALWTEAAVAIRRYDRDFAHLLQMKAQYWCEPTRWSADDVQRAGISIKAVSARARAFLGGEI